MSTLFLLSRGRQQPTNPAPFDCICVTHVETRLMVIHQKLISVQNATGCRKSLAARSWLFTLRGYELLIAGLAIKLFCYQVQLSIICAVFLQLQLQLHTIILRWLCKKKCAHVCVRLTSNKDFLHSLPHSDWSKLFCHDHLIQ